MRKGMAIVKSLKSAVSLKTAFRIGIGLLLSWTSVAGYGVSAQAQAPAAAPAPATSQRGAVKTVSGNTITMVTDAGQAYTVSVAAGARILQVPVGSTDLKSATAIQLTDIAAGDHILVTGKAGDTPEAFSAVRVILMKSADIAQKNAAEQADWKARGTGGIVTAIDPGTDVITISVGTKKLAVETSSKTEFRRFAGDSVKYQDAKPGTLAQIGLGDQLQARGAKSADGTSIEAEEIVSGSFKNLSGTLAAVDSAAGTITLKDLATKKTVIVKVTANSELKTLPPEAASRFLMARQRGAGAGGGTTPPAGGGSPDGAPRRPVGMDLSAMLARLPSSSLADLHAGDVVMIVASAGPSSSDLTAVTLLSGVAPLLAATPSGEEPMTLSPWNVGAMPEGVPGQ